MKERQLGSIADDPELYLATVAELLVAEGLLEAAQIVRDSQPKVEETGYDNWNGGTTIWTIYLRLHPTEYAKLGTRRNKLEEQIKERLKPVLEQYTNEWFTVTIAPKVQAQSNWRNLKNELSRTTRQNIIDGLKIDRISWSGRVGDVEFLQRLYDLESLPSYDGRFKNAAQDIWQHRVNNPTDWEDDWVYEDRRFNLLAGSSEMFLRFLCEVVHPVVRPDRDEALKLVSQFNDQLGREGWSLVEEEKIAGRPRFVPLRIQPGARRSVSRARTVAEALDAGWMQKEIERLENAVERDPALAIGTAKDLIETCSKSILTRRGIQVSRKADLPELSKLLAKELQLVPEGIPDQAKGAETIRLILRNLSALTQYLAELRGLYGSGHGRDGKYKGLEPRHARLAVATAVAFIDFVTETHYQRAQSAISTVATNPH